MKRILLLLFSLFFLFPQSAEAATNFRINNFNSEITINKDTTITVREEVILTFTANSHGIFRYVPVKYRSENQKINSNLSVLSVTDEKSRSYKYTNKKIGDNVEIKIGDPDVLVNGTKTYVITYKMTNIIQRFEDHDELYWNAFGSDWGTAISKGEVSVNSPNAKITEVACYLGQSGTKNPCTKSFTASTAEFTTGTKFMRAGDDLTVVVALAKDNGLAFPGRAEKAWHTVLNSIPYFLATSPAIMMYWLWRREGRDVAVAPAADYSVKYGPVQGLTASELGVLIDERADVRDISAEIMNLARLGFVRIEKVKKKNLIGSTSDYALERLDKDTNSLSPFQKLLLEKLFDGAALDKTLKSIEKFHSGAAKKDALTKLAGLGKYVYISSLRRVFYKSLKELNEALYKDVTDKGLFDGNPTTVRTRYFFKTTFIAIMLLSVTKIVSNLSSSYGVEELVPLLFIFIASLVVAGIIARYMPRRTIKGRQLYLEAKGLANNLKKGKWRHEIYEKNLYLEEMLPTAIALGVVKEFSSKMKELGAEPPSYFTGVTTANLASSITSFDQTTKSALLTGANSRGSGWSGGSGFSGGGGGGFGGGGGGSW